MRLNELKRASLMLTICLTLVFCSSALAENPASSTSEKQAEKEQLKNPDHIIDDCRAVSGAQVKEGCKTQAELKKHEMKNEAKMKSGTSMDDVTKK
ncbi:hypothetical protein [Raoultella planticola]|uniref:hypothetical protein n=1 Tax=Raoultella planticola TaxID=575 RepID=UPI0013D677A8|nr:hypothetical protein [Raoultella planticola]